MFGKYRKLRCIICGRKAIRMRTGRKTWLLCKAHKKEVIKGAKKLLDRS